MPGARRGDALEGVGAEAGQEGETSLEERWRALREICESEYRFRRIAEASRDMVTETNSEGRFLYVSSACKHVLGYAPSELVGTRALDLQHEEDLPRFLRELREGRSSPDSFAVGPHRLRHKDGSWVWVEATGLIFSTPNGDRRIIGVARDITGLIESQRVRRELEERALHAQNLESLGVLAGGLAHDFNNLLTPIVGNAAIVHADLPEDSPLRKRIEMIRTAAKRASELTGQMLAYAGEGVTRVMSLDISRSVRDMALLLESTATRAAILRFDLAGDLPLIEVDSPHVNQVIMNLVGNASDSLPESGGMIEVRTGSTEVDRAYLDACTIGTEGEPGTYVFLEVRDDGHGVSPEDRERIFDPFFTTRFTGRGLGLAAVHGVVGRHAGALRFESTLGEGSCFRVLFPVERGGATSLIHVEDPSLEVKAKAAAAPRRGSVLVVDDDEGASDVMSSALERAGYETICAPDGPAALERFSERADAIVGVVLDWMMPGMSGPETLDRIREIRPETPALLVSGFVQRRTESVLMDRERVGFIRKPFEIKDLLCEVDRLFCDPDSK